MHAQETVFFHIFVIFSGASLLATLALYARQSLLVSHIVLGALLGPWGLKVVSSAEKINDISHIGIVFLLFLLGLNLQPKSLLALLNKTIIVTFLSSLVFTVIGIAIGGVFGFSWGDSLLIGISAAFSSTILGVKLLPTTVLHHRRAGEIIVSILLLQDVLAILVLLVLKGLGGEENSSPWHDVFRLTFSLPLLIGASWLFSRYVLIYLIGKFDRIQEYIFLLAIGWCLGMAELASWLGLSHEIGAFIGGVVLASYPITLFIAENLKPLRDFFLVLFFFSLGASLNLEILPSIFFPAILLAGFMLSFQPRGFFFLLSPRGGKLHPFF